MDLCLGPGQGFRPVERVAIVMLVNEVQKLGPGRRNDGPERDSHDLAGRNRQPISEREYRIEYGADRVRKRSSIRHRNSRAHSSAPA